MTDHTEREREERQSKQQQEFRRVLRDVARDDFVQEWNRRPLVDRSIVEAMAGFRRRVWRRRLLHQQVLDRAVLEDDFPSLAARAGT